MDANNKNGLVDGVLDEALDEFGSGEPRSGLENRVLASLLIERQRIAERHRWWWALGSAIAAATLAGAIWLGNAPGMPKDLVKVSRESKKSKEIGALKVEQASRPQMPPLTSNANIGREQRRLISRTRPATLSRLRQFPSARPLSPQEKLLLAYVSTAPDSELIAILARAEDASDLRISDLQIPPLSGPETQEGNYTK